MGRHRHGLSDEDRRVWEQVTRRVTPRAPVAPEPPRPPAAASAPSDIRPTQTAVPPPAPLPHFRLGERAAPTASGHDLAPSISEALAGGPVRMDRKAHGRLKRGKLVPEARIDLHGMTQSEAHPALMNFIRGAHARGLRLVLVITGKGRDREDPGPMPTRRGVLKHQVPHWLSSGPMRLMVLDVIEAHRRHGGTGAYYVYLSRQR